MIHTQNIKHVYFLASITWGILLDNIYEFHLTNYAPLLSLDMVYLRLLCKTSHDCELNDKHILYLIVA
jgi:hypothetical protein